MFLQRNSHHVARNEQHAGIHLLDNNGPTITIEFKGIDLVNFHILLENSQKWAVVHYFFASSPFSKPALSTPPFGLCIAPSAVADKKVEDICFISFPVVGTISKGLL